MSGANWTRQAETEWVMIIEAVGDRGSASLAEEVQEIIRRMSSTSPSAVIGRDRYAVQFYVCAHTPEAASRRGLWFWREAALGTPLGSWNLVRAELKTPAELAAEIALHEEQTSAISATEALEAAYRATRRLVHVRHPVDASAVVVGLVYDLGGKVVPARLEDPDVLPLDLSFGWNEPVHPAAEPCSVPRLHLEEVLPAVVEDAWHALRQAGTRDRTPGVSVRLVGDNDRSGGS